MSRLHSSSHLANVNSKFSISFLENNSHNILHSDPIE